MRYPESLTLLLNRLNPKLGAEVGVHKGTLSEYTLGRFPDLTLHMIDQYAEDPQYPNQKENRLLAMQRTLGFGKRANRIYGTSQYAAEIFQQSGIELDYVFIDADHSYKSVLADMNLWYPLVRNGGMFSGHDFGKTDIPGVTEAVEEWFSDMGLEFEVAEGHIWHCTKRPPAKRKHTRKTDDDE